MGSGFEKDSNTSVIQNNLVKLRAFDRATTTSYLVQFCQGTRENYHDIIPSPNKLELGLPSFDTLLHNYKVSFYMSVSSCDNLLVQSVQKVFN